MNATLKHELIRAGELSAMTLVSSGIGFLSGPDATNLIPTQYAVVVTVALIPALNALYRYLKLQVAKPAAPVTPAPPAAPQA